MFYHRDQDDYVAALERRQPRIAETLGIYFDADREAHFFAGDDQERRPRSTTKPSTNCSRNRGPPPGTSATTANFWIIEGIATYFETLREHRDPQAGLYYTIGESSAGRLPAARERLLAEAFYVPLDELTRLGKDDLQRYPELAKLYSQSAGLAAFLMDGDEGRYREPLVRLPDGRVCRPRRCRIALRRDGRDACGARRRVSPLPRELAVVGRQR